MRRLQQCVGGGSLYRQPGSPTVVCQTSHSKHLTLLSSLALRCLHDSLRDIQPLLSRLADLSHHHHRKPDAFLSPNGRRPGKLLLQIKRYMENWKQYLLQYFLARVTETWTRDCVETKCQSNNCERFQRCLYQTMATITRRRRLIRTSYSRWLRR